MARRDSAHVDEFGPGPADAGETVPRPLDLLDALDVSNELDVPDLPIEAPSREDAIFLLHASMCRNPGGLRWILLDPDH